MLVAGLAVALTLLQENARLRDPDAVIAAVEAHGPKAVVEEIWLDDPARRALLEGVGAAKAEWLRAALALKPGTDAGSSEELDGAFAQGLLASPAQLLPILRELWWQRAAMAVCEFDWDSELPGGVAQYVTRLEAAVRRDRVLPASLGQACRSGIQRTRARLHKHESDERGRPTKG
jgi:hypothetical protein